MRWSGTRTLRLTRPILSPSTWTVIYAGPVIYGQDADLVAVTLSLAHDGQGRPELVLHYQNNEVILSDGTDGKFHLQPQE